jgi:uncharacterized protein (DUF1501 family)
MDRIGDRNGGRLRRRELLKAGGLGLLSGGLGLLGAGLGANVAPVAHAATASAAKAGRAKSLIILYLYGAPSQLETYDPKPDAPREIRGQFDSIATAIPGLRFCEHLPKLAKVIDRAAVIRSMSHPYNIHSAAYTLTGVPHVDVPMELNPFDARHYPYIGSVLDHLAERDGLAAAGSVPRSMGLPFQFSDRSPTKRAGPYGGFLGSKFDPIWTEFEGDGTRKVNRWRGKADTPVADPYFGIQSNSRLSVSNAARLPKEITLDRLNERRSLLEQFDAQRRDLDAAASVQAHERFSDMALGLMTSGGIHQALDLSKEKPELREAYGMTLFGQATLAARRLVEAGSQIVTVFWDEVGITNSAWDTHFDHYSRLGDELLPGLDAALSTLLIDLEQRGLLESTMVACISEHGRTPKMDDVRGGGRGHWSKAYGGILAGGGIRGGQVLGRTDEFAATVAERPVSPKDVLATMYHNLGVDPESMIRDRLGRPLPIVPDGHVIRELL